MKMYLVVAVVLALGLVFSVSGVSLAQEEEETEYSWGAIVGSVSSNQIVVREYDYDSDEEVNVTYTVDPQLDLRNVESLKNIKVGASIEIDYVIRKGKNVAVGIEVEKLSQKEEYTPSQTYEEEPDYSSEEIEY